MLQIPIAEQREIVLRGLAGETIKKIASEVGRANSTVTNVLSYYAVRGHGRVDDRKRELGEKRREQMFSAFDELNEIKRKQSMDNIEIDEIAKLVNDLRNAPNMDYSKLVIEALFLKAADVIENLASERKVV